VSAPSPAPQRKDPIGADLVLPVIAVAFTIYFFVSVSDLAWEAKMNATLIGVTLLVLIAILLVRLGLKFVGGSASLSIAPLIDPRRVLWQRIALIALSAAFVFVIPWLGLTLGLFLLTAALMLLLRAGTWRAVTLTSAIVATTAYLLFIALLDSRMPRGPIEKLLALWF
jgi:hypothetical protein